MEVEFRDVCLTRGNRQVLDGVTFTTGGGGVFLVYGPSGAGKTSLLRLVNRLDEPDRGEVRVDSRPVRQWQPLSLRRQVGMIFQEPRLMAGTVRENILYAADYHGITVDEGELLHRTGLAGMSGREVSDLSGGEQQRVAIARALAVKPAVLCMDEPTTSLDQAATQAMEKILLDLVEEGNLHLIFVTHDQGQLLRLGGRGIVIARGRVAFVGDIGQWLKEAADHV